MAVEIAAAMNGSGCAEAQGCYRSGMRTILPLLALVLVGCKTLPSAPPPEPVNAPIAVYSSGLPTLSDIRYRPIGRVPFSGELKDLEQSTTTRLDGYATITATDRATVRIRTYLERISFQGSGRNIRAQVANGLASDYELDAVGHVRRIHPVKLDFELTGLGDFNEEAEKAILSNFTGEFGTVDPIKMTLQPKLSSDLTIGSDLAATTRESFFRRFLVADAATRDFVSDVRLGHFLTRRIPSSDVAALTRFENSERVTGVAYVEGYEFLSTRFRSDVSTAGLQISVTGRRLIDPFSGQTYLVESRSTITENGQSVRQ